MTQFTSKYGALRRYRTTLRNHNSFIHCVAFINLLFLLLIFTALATQVVRISGIKVNLPRAEAPQETVLGKLIVSVAANDNGEYQYYFRNRALSFDALRKEFQDLKERRNKTVIIRADDKVPSGTLNKLISEVHQADMAVLIAVQPPDARPEMRFE